MKIIVECCHCHKKFEAYSHKAKYCSWLCRKVELTKHQFPVGSDYVECKICGLRGRQLIQHIEKVHGITTDEYCKKFGLTYKDLQSESLSEQMSTNIKKACSEGRTGFVKGGYNPSKSEECKAGRNSAWSMNFKGYDGLSDQEKTEKIAELGKVAQQTRDKNHNNATKLDYYTSRGYSKSEARSLLKDRQQTFTLEKCIKWHGEIEGRRIYFERQENWQKTMKSKPLDEIERINRLKFKNTGYSDISQQLFNSIAEQIGKEYSQIFYATNSSTADFNEYMVHDNVTGKNYFLDFYIKDNNKVIEFDGDYWHGEKRGNQERDRRREDALKKLGFVNIYHVKERDYRDNPDKVVDECVKFIRG